LQANKYSLLTSKNQPIYYLTNMMTGAAIRQQFMDFFKSKGHVIVPSAPIVVKDDPTLMFTNAGMNQFKDYFLGNKPAPYKRAADTQKCLRVSGKHNDLEEVGVDTYHHTMFEMLGNWSFGDYFKKEAIEWSWELLTEVYKIPKDRLYVSIFEGDEKEGLPRDNEAFEEWKKWIAEDRILLGNKKDNFWEMGDTGPCGPCTEIHVDTRPDAERKEADGKTLVNNDHPQVIEIWNNVFIQFNRKKDGTLEPLPDKHVDTGMGLERLVRVLQGKTSNYDTDIFQPLIYFLEIHFNKKYNSNEKTAIAMRVIADHIRAVSFAIADGQLPSNNGAGYVIRRILRRAVRYGYSFLDAKGPFIFELVDTLDSELGSVFPEIKQQKEFIKKVIKEEETSFFKTLSEGIWKLLIFIQEAFHYTLPISKAESVESHRKKVVPGKLIFELYDTYGFPPDLTQLIAKEKGFTVDSDGYAKEMQKQKSRSRAAGAIDTEDWVVLKEGSNKFVGYDSLDAKASVLKYRKVKAKGKEMYQIVLDTTPFYAESGGQVGDSGTLTIDDSQLTIIDTKKDNDLIIHFTENIPANLSGDVTAKVDSLKRKNITVHHSATHLMHAALRNVLGKHVAQKGSLVNEEHLRFDFSHFAKMTAEETAKVETLVNEKIRENIPVVIKEMPKDEALKLGAMALFGEKYGDMVRVVIMDATYSVELCGGTHIGATGEIGLFKITHETAVAAGVRRVEAVCGIAAENYVKEKFALVDNISESLKNPKDIIKAIENLKAENAELKKHADALEARQLVGIRNELLQKDEIINGVTFIGEIIEVGNADALKKLCLDLKHKLNDHVAVLCTNIGGKPFVAVGISDTVVAAKNLDAGKIIKEYIAPLIKGGGGGQKTLATAAGTDISKMEEIITKVKELL
jgi:alanyl-tRNA synthetase